MNNVLNIYEAIVKRCMLETRYVTRASWSEVNIKGFGSLITENCGDKIKASLINHRGIIVFEKYFPKNERVANVA